MTAVRIVLPSIHDILQLHTKLYADSWNYTKKKIEPSQNLNLIAKCRIRTNLVRTNLVNLLAKCRIRKNLVNLIAKCRIRKNLERVKVTGF